MFEPIFGFDWDGGNLGKCVKHGVSIEEIETLLRRRPKVAADQKHSDQEQRFIAVGKTRSGRPIFVVFTFRRKGGLQLLRPISARYMHEKEARAYEAEGP